ncbi:MAG: substrate-binding domain-containing protein [Candidatus Limnocylindrales bacterium]
MIDRARLARIAVLAVAGLMVVAPAATVAQDASGSPAASGEPLNPYAENGAVAGSGEGKTVGYISLGDSLPFVKMVSDSIAEQATIAGLDLVACDAQVKAEIGLECGQTLGTRSVQGVLNFNLYADSSEAICNAYGNVPTIAIDIHQAPCEVAFFGADNLHAGTLGGQKGGELLQAENGCTYDHVITLESQAAGPSVNGERVKGMIDGFASVCGPIDPAKLQQVEVGGTTELALAKMSDLLPTLTPGGITVIMSLNDDMAIGAQSAAETAGRGSELRIIAQGADPTAWQRLACNPTWLADVGYSPQLYGRTLVPAIIDVLDGKTVPATMFTPNEALTAETIRDVYPDTPAC